MFTRFVNAVTGRNLQPSSAVPPPNSSAASDAPPASPVSPQAPTVFPPAHDCCAGDASEGGGAGSAPAEFTPELFMQHYDPGLFGGRAAWLRKHGVTLTRAIAVQMAVREPNSATAKALTAMGINFAEEAAQLPQDGYHDRFLVSYKPGLNLGSLHLAGSGRIGWLLKNGVRITECIVAELSAHEGNSATARAAGILRDVDAAAAAAEAARGGAGDAVPDGTQETSGGVGVWPLPLPGTLVPEDSPRGDVPPPAPRRDASVARAGTPPVGAAAPHSLDASTITVASDAESPRSRGDLAQTVAALSTALSGVHAPDVAVAAAAALADGDDPFEFFTAPPPAPAANGSAAAGNQGQINFDPFA